MSWVLFEADLAFINAKDRVEGRLTRIYQAWQLATELEKRAAFKHMFTILDLIATFLYFVVCTLLQKSTDISWL